MRFIQRPFPHKKMFFEQFYTYLRKSCCSRPSLGSDLELFEKSDTKTEYWESFRIPQQFIKPG
jgi:hypothetical protein